MNFKIASTLIAVVALASFIIYLNFIHSSPEVATPLVTNKHDHAHDESQSLLGKGEIARGEQVLSTGVDTFVAKNNTLPVEMNGEEKVFEKDTIVWQESSESKQVLEASGLIPADVTDEAYVEVDLQELRTVEVGEYIDLYIPQFGGSYTGEVDFIQTHPNGDRTVEAHIPGAGSLYAAVITIGENAIYGNLATPRDVFAMEGIGKHAWIAPKSSMMGSHIEHIPAEMQPSEYSDYEDVFTAPPTESPADDKP